MGWIFIVMLGVRVGVRVLGLWLRLKLKVRVCTSNGRSKLSAVGLYYGNERV